MTTHLLILIALFIVYLVECDIKFEPRIINGMATTTNEYPWMVSIQWAYKDDANRRRNVVCSGSLIRKTYPAAVLTAAHCVGLKILGYGGRIYYADINRTYPYDITKNNSEDNYITLRAFYYYIADAYSIQPTGATKNLLTDYDLGILLLDGEVEDIEPITLYNPSNIQHTAQCCKNDQMVRSFGYGFLNDNRDRTESVRYLDMRYMTNIDNCSQLVIECVEDNDGFTTSYKDDIVYDGSAICAYSNNAGICQGDSGGPLVFIDDDGNIIQIGIGSQSCCMPGVPNMFTTIEYFYDTIQEVLADDTGWIDYLPNKTTDIDINGCYQFKTFSITLLIVASLLFL